ncbi:MAG TPA: DUF3422 domain-containing protein [Usitatibacter sp.]|nr:DUF3422 domain-containing protein [Usitatibacter sp.]
MQPTEHRLRRLLNDEVHARPPLRLGGEQRIVHLVIQHEREERPAHREALARLVERSGAVTLASHPDHVIASAGDLRLKWQAHAEFASYMFCAPPRAGETPAQLLSRAGWDAVAASLPGHVLAAACVDLVPFTGDKPPPDAFRAEGETVVGGAIGEGNGWAYADFRIREDGFTHFLVLNRAMGLGQAGRMVQRLLDIETYRMLALEAFPVARAAAPELATMEAELGEIVQRIASGGPERDAKLLDDLTRLAARVERLHSVSRYRFDAARAYDAIVRQRLDELRESRIPGLSTVSEFMQRRMAPAMATCRSTARRIDDLAVRVSRASDLLRTRVDIVREEQNQALLASMNRRAHLQLRLQQTVEGLSIVVITYYGASLVGVAAKALRAAGARIEPELAEGIALPIVALLVFAGVRRVRKALAGEA